jgi:hypothetical protein
MSSVKITLWALCSVQPGKSIRTACDDTSGIFDITKVRWTRHNDTNWWHTSISIDASCWSIDVKIHPLPSPKEPFTTASWQMIIFDPDYPDWVDDVDSSVAPLDHFGIDLKKFRCTDNEDGTVLAAVPRSSVLAQ